MSGSARNEGQGGDVKGATRKPTDLPAVLMWQINAARLPEPMREWRFAALIAGGPGKGLRARLQAEGLKDWRFDLAWPALRIALEVDGGGWVMGRHSRGAGIESDCAKISNAVARGWRVLRVTPAQVKSGQALKWVEMTMARVG